MHEHFFHLKNLKFPPAPPNEFKIPNAVHVYQILKIKLILDTIEACLIKLVSKHIRLDIIWKSMIVSNQT